MMQIFYRTALPLLLAIPFSLLPQASRAAPLTLDIQGQIAKTNDAAHSVYRMSGAELLALPVHSITTSTIWTPRVTFTGPLLSDVLKFVGGKGDQVELRTLDDYAVTVSVAEAVRYGAILAYSMDGRRLKVRDFGPLFLIYPRDAYPAELTGALADAKFVWQVKGLILK